LAARDLSFGLISGAFLTEAISSSFAIRHGILEVVNVIEGHRDLAAQFKGDHPEDG
jgi:hypothetical protein